MMILLLIIAILLICYTVLLMFYWQSWKAIPVFKATGKNPSTTISVIIPARNEEENIGNLLQALLLQSYPRTLFEIIVIDDHSVDKTAEIAQQFAGVRVISLKNEGINSYKKKAIETGIGIATGELIVTTDADCIPGRGWLMNIAAFQDETNATFIAAPVSFTIDSSPLQIFQAMDFMMLQGITGAAVFRKHLSMSNGANLAYEKKVFYEVNGFKNIDHIASGDDMLLMHKIATAYPSRVKYLKSKEAIMSTLPMNTWKAFFNQRTRWASKATQYNDPRILPILLLVYLVNLSILTLTIAICWNHDYLLFAFISIVWKTAAELPLFISLARFFDKQWTVKLFPLFQPLHIIYTLISGFLGQFGKYEWKGREIR